MQQETSLEAFRSQKDKAPNDELKILSWIKGSEVGATCDEVESCLRIIHQTASARIRDLRGRGKLVDTGSRRKTRTGRSAIVWRAANA